MGSLGGESGGKTKLQPLRLNSQLRLNVGMDVGGITM